jgi:hypothetical protein
MRPFAFAVVIWLLPALAAAQGTDVVHLPGGGLVRGSVVEYVPGDHVTIQLATGEVRTYAAGEFANVAIGGSAPAPVAAPSVPAPPAASTPMAHLSVGADGEGLSLHHVIASAIVPVWTGRTLSAAQVDSFQLICNAPCEIDVPAGSYILGVAQGSGTARRAGHDRADFAPGTVTRLAVEYDSREAIRIVGWITFVGGVLAGTAIMTVPILTDPNADITGAIIAGSIVAGVGMIVALPMVLLQDHAEVRYMRDIARALTSGVRF